MRQTITLVREDGSTEEALFKTTATTAIRYRQTFGRELLGDITAIISSIGADGFARFASAPLASADGKVDTEELIREHPDILKALVSIAGSGKLEAVSQLAYIMYSQAAGRAVGDTDFEDYMEWLDRYDSMSLLTGAADFIMLYLGNRAGTSSVKKNSGQPTGASIRQSIC